MYATKGTMFDHIRRHGIPHVLEYEGRGRAGSVERRARGSSGVRADTT